MKFTPQDRLIVALDREDLSSCQKIVEDLGTLISTYKVGIELFTAVGPEILVWLKKKNKKVFLDLKFHDIPRSVAQAALTTLKYEIFMLNLHLSGGEIMARETVTRVKEISKKLGKPSPLIIGVTVLTSLNNADLRRIGIREDLDTLVLNLATLGKQAGLDGVVASAREAKRLKESLGQEFLIVTPGLRLPSTSPEDQKRVATPREALENGADFLVVGRSIIGAANAYQVTQEILSEIEKFQNAH